MGIVTPGQSAVGGGGTILSPPRLILSITTGTPPVSPSTGDAYIIPASATGDWSTHVNDIAQWSGSAWNYLDPSESWFAYVDDEDTYYLYTGTAWESISGSAPPLAHATSHEDGGADEVTIESLITAGVIDTVPISNGTGSLAMGIPRWDESQIFYVSKAGNDSNDGKCINQAFLTIAKAITEVNALTPSTTNRFAIVVLDGGNYNEASQIVPNYTHLYAPNATFGMTITLSDYSMVTVREIICDSYNIVGNGVYAFAKATYLKSNYSDSILISGYDLHVDIGYIAPGGGNGIKLNSGIIYGKINWLEASNGGHNLYFTATNGRADLTIGYLNNYSNGDGINCDDTTTASLRIGCMTGGTSNIDISAGNIYAEIGSMSGATNAYSNTGGGLYLFVGKMTGSEFPVSGTTEITKAGIIEAHAASHADGGSDEITPLAIGGKTLTGFPNRTDSTISMNGSNFEIAPAVTSFDFWSNGNKFTKSGTDAVAISNDQTLHYVYYDTSGMLQVSTSLWDIKSNNALVATVYKDSSNYVITDERHSYNRDRNWHEWAHNTIGTRYENGLTGAFTNTTFSVAQGVIHDEDIDFDTGGSKTNCQRWYRNSGLTAMRIELGAIAVYKVTNPGVDDTINYDNAGTLTPATNNKYVNHYVYATNCSAYPIVSVIGQAEHTNLLSARNEALPSILLSTAEWKLLYRVTYQNIGGTPTYIEAEDYRSVSTGPATDAVATDHSGLIGRDAVNSHPTSAITGLPIYITPSDDLATILNAATDNTHYIITEGAHTITAPITLSGLTNVKISATGAIISASLSAALDPLISISDCDHLTLSEMKFNITSDAAGRSVIEFVSGGDCKTILLEHLEGLTSTGTNSSYLIQADQPSIAMTDVHIHRCTTSGYWYPVRFATAAVAGKEARLIHVEDCDFRTTAGGSDIGVRMDGNATAQIYDCAIESSYFTGFVAGVNLDYDARTKIENNIFVGLSGNSRAITTGQNGSYNSIQHNIIDHNTVSLAVRINGTFPRVIGNTIYIKGLYHGLLIKDASDGVIANNVISSDGSGDTGIYLDNADNMVIEGNRCHGFLNYGILEEADCDGNRYSGNLLEGNTAGAFSLAGINRIWDNIRIKRLINTDSPYTVSLEDRVLYCDTDSGNITINLPAGAQNQSFRVINVGSSGNNVLLTPNGSETIQGGAGGAALTLTDGQGWDGSWDVTEYWWGIISHVVEKFEINFENGGAVLNTGNTITGSGYVPFDCEIIAAILLADQSGSIVMDIWVDSYANYPPTVVDTITAAAKPTLSSAIKYKDTTLSGWSKELSKDDFILANIDSVSTITALKLILIVVRK